MKAESIVSGKWGRNRVEFTASLGNSLFGKWFRGKEEGQNLLLLGEMGNVWVDCRGCKREEFTAGDEHIGFNCLGNGLVGE